jgi:glutaryl-CoA dehydrogenase
VVWARTEDGIRGFLVEKGTPGFTRPNSRQAFDARVGDVEPGVFSDCRVPEARDAAGREGTEGPLSCLTQARYGIGWGVIGAAMDCYETARSVFGAAQAVRRPAHRVASTGAGETGGMITEITKAQLLALQAGG